MDMHTGVYFLSYNRPLDTTNLIYSCVYKGVLRRHVPTCTNGSLSGTHKSQDHGTCASWHWPLTIFWLRQHLRTSYTSKVCRDGAAWTFAAAQCTQICTFGYHTICMYVYMYIYLYVYVYIHTRVSALYIFTCRYRPVDGFHEICRFITGTAFMRLWRYMHIITSASTCLHTSRI
jgi:hypothetical protein